MTTLTINTAKKLFNDVVAGKKENTKEVMDSIFKFASDSKVTLLDLLNKGNIEKALKAGFIKAPKGDKLNNNNNNNNKVANTVTTIKEEANQVATKKAEMIEAVKKNKVNFDVMTAIIKANTTKKPDTLFRLVWKEGRDIIGMEVLHIHPIARKSINMIGIMLEWNKDEKTFKKLDVVGAIDYANIDFDGKKAIVFDSNGDSKDLGIYLPIPKVEEAKKEEVKAEKPKVEKPKAVRPRSLKKKDEVVTTEEGEKKGE